MLYSLLQAPRCIVVMVNYFCMSCEDGILHTLNVYFTRPVFHSRPLSISDSQNLRSLDTESSRRFREALLSRASAPIGPNCPIAREKKPTFH